MASGDLDIKNGAAHIIGTLPTVADLAGEIVIVGGNAYVRAPGQRVFTVSAASSLSYNPTVRTTGPLYLVSAIIGLAASPLLNPQLIGTENRAGGACYHIRVQATGETVAAKLSMKGAGVEDAIMDLWIYQSTFQIQSLEIHTNDPAVGPSAIRMVLSKYDAIDPIEVPPPAQLPTSGPTFALPS
jgi:hypothetical protein